MCVVAAAALLPPGASQAQSAREPVGFYGAVGGAFHVLTAEGTWSQRFVTVINRTDRPRRLRVAYLTRDEYGQQYRYSVVIPLPPHSIRRAAMATRPNKLPGTPARAGGTVQVVQTYALKDDETGRDLALFNPLQAKVPAGAVPVAQISDAALQARYDSNQYLRLMAESPLGDVRTTKPQLALLPDRWYGYDLAEVVLLRGLRPGELRVSQLDALLNWVRSGGQLVLAVNHAMEDMMVGRLGRVAGVGMLGTHRVNRLQVEDRDPESKAREKHTEVVLRDPLPMAELYAQDADVLYEANGLPLLTRRRVGQGAVFVLAVPPLALRGSLDPEKPDDRRWHGGLQFIWRAVDRQRRRRPAVDGEKFLKRVTIRGTRPPTGQRSGPATKPAKTTWANQAATRTLRPAVETLNQLSGRLAPGRNVPVLIMAGLTAVVLVGGALLRLRRRGELLWVLLLPMGLVVGVCLYTYAALQTETSRLSYVGLITGTGDGTALVQEVFAFHSGPSRRTVNLSAGEANGTIEPVGAAMSGALGQHNIRTDRVMVLPDVVLGRDASRVFYAEAPMKLPGIEGHLTYDAKGVTATLDSRFDAEIRKAVLRVNQRSYGVGTVASGQATDLTITEAEALQGWNVFTSSALPGPDDDRRNELLGHLQAGIGRNVAPDPLLIGYAKLSPLKPLPAETTDYQGESVIVWPLKIVPPAPGTKVRVPAGFVTLKMTGTQRNLKDGRFHPIQQERRMVIRGTPLGIAGRLKAATATLDLNLSATGYRLEVYKGAQPKGDPSEADLLKTIENPSGKLPPFRFTTDTGPPAGEFVFTVKVSRITKATGQDDKIAWRIGDIQMSLQGEIASDGQ